MTGLAAFPLTAAPPSPGLAARLAGRWRLWREHRRWVGELADVAALGRLDGMLNDIALTRAELGALIEEPSDSGRQFETMAQMARVDLRGLDPLALREAHWTCTRCEHRTACKRWLRSGVWEEAGDPRCPNAALLRH